MTDGECNQYGECGRTCKKISGKRATTSLRKEGTNEARQIRFSFWQSVRCALLGFGDKEIGHFKDPFLHCIHCL